MNKKSSKNFLSRLANVNVLFRYFRESASVVQQGAALKDKFILLIYYLRIPLIVLKSLITDMHFREIEEQNKYLPGNVTLKNKNGIFYCGNNIMTVYIADEDNEKNLYPYFEVKSGCFIDIGAHIGKYSIKTGRNPNVTVIALEPDLFNFSLLKKNITLNRLSNIICLNKGAFSSNGQVPFHESGRGEGQHSIFKNQDSVSLTTIEVNTIDKIVFDLNVEHSISLIKIDTEGAEAEIIKGAGEVIKRNCPDLIIEVLKENSGNLEEIKKLLLPYDYKIEKLDDDNYFCSVAKQVLPGILRN